MSAPSVAWSKFSYPVGLTEALRAQGCSVVPCDPELSSIKHVLREDGRRVVHLHWLHPLSRRRTYHESVWTSARFLMRLAMARKRGVRVVWTVHNRRDHEATRPMLDTGIRRLISKFADAIITHSDGAREIVVNDFDLDRAKVHVIPHPNYINVYPRIIEPVEARENLGIGKDETVLLFFGLIRPYKGVEQLLDAFAKVDAKNLRLRIVGRLTNKKRQAALRTRVALDSRVELVPSFIPDEELQTHFKAADAVVLPYKQILTSGAALLAMSFGKACVAPRMGCLIDVFAPEGVFHYEASDQEGLVDAIRRCVASRDSLEERGRANLNRAAAWTWESSARQTLEVYGQLYSN